MAVERIAKVACCVVALLAPVAITAAAPNDARLREAVKDRDQATVHRLLQGKIDVNAPAGDGTTALHWAVQWDDVDTIGRLVAAGANANAATDLGVTPLHLACANANAVTVTTLLKAGATVKATRSTGETPLMTCARTGNVETVKALLVAGADANAREPVQGQTVLMWAAAENHAAVAQVLIDHGADLRARTAKAGYGPLLFAARNGAADAVRVLLADGADVNEAATDGTSPLLAAVYTGHWDLAESLLEQGADPNNAKAGYTALHWAAGSWENDISGNLGPDAYEWIGGRGPGKLELVKALLDYGADPNARLEKRPPRYGYGSGSRLNFAGATPFILAGLGGDAGIMRALLEAGADPRLTTRDGTTALMTAAGFGRIHGESRAKDDEALEAVRVAIEVGIDVNAANRISQTALHGATYFQSDPVVQLLIEHGAKVNARNKAGETPLAIAEGFAGVDTGGNTFYSDGTAALLRKAGGVNTMEFSAVVRKIEASCPVPIVLVGDPDQDASDRYGARSEYGAGLRIKTTEAIQFKDVGCQDMKVGTRVRVTGTRLGHKLDKNGLPWDGSFDASQIEILK